MTQPRRVAKPALKTSTLVPASEWDVQHEETYRRLHLTDVTVETDELDAVDVEESHLDGVRLDRIRFDRLRISDSVLTHTSMANVRAHDSLLLRVQASSSRFTGMSWTDGALKDVRLEQCRAEHTSWRGTTFTNVHLVGCDLRHADFGSADLRGAHLEDCDLTSAQLSGADMRGALLTGCRLEGLRGVTALKGAHIPAGDLHDLLWPLVQAAGIVVEE